MKSSSEMMHVWRKWIAADSWSAFLPDHIWKGMKKGKEKFTAGFLHTARTGQTYNNQMQCFCCQTKSSTALPGLHQPCPISPPLPAARPTSTLGCIQLSSMQFFVGNAPQVTVCYKFWCNIYSCFFHRMEASILPGSRQIPIKFSVLNK